MRCVGENQKPEGGLLDTARGPQALPRPTDGYRPTLGNFQVGHSAASLQLRPSRGSIRRRTGMTAGLLLVLEEAGCPDDLAVGLKRDRELSQL